MSEHPKRLLLIFLKEPIEGTVKTRLASTVGDKTAVQMYRAMVATLLMQLKWIPDCHYRFCFAPQDAMEAMQFWLIQHLEHKLTNKAILPRGEGIPDVDFQPQTSGDLGDRLKAAFSQGFEEGFSQVMAIGADCPFISARWIDAAFLSSKLTDVTLGPTPDGGYYLIGMNTFSKVPFTDIPWSSKDTLQRTLESLEKENLSSQLIPELSDIDHEEDWLAALETPLGARLKKNLKDEQNEPTGFL